MENKPDELQTEPAAEPDVDTPTPDLPPSQEEPKRTVTNRTRPGEPPRRPTIVLTAPKGWLTTLICAISAATLTWAIPAALTLLVFLINANNPWMMRADWNDALLVGSSIWAIAMGAPIDLAAPITLMPLGLTLLNLAIVIGAIRIARPVSPAAAALTIPGFSAMSVIIAAVSQAPLNLLNLTLAATTISTVGWVLAYASPLLDSLRNRTSPHHPTSILRGAHDATVLAGITTILAAITLTIGGIIGADRIREISAISTTTTSDQIGIWVAQLFYLPDALAWTLSWLAGPGFHLAQDAIVIPTKIPPGMVPAIPILGAIPTTALTNEVVLIPIIVGVIHGTAQAWRNREKELVDHLLRALAQITMYALLIGTWMWLSTGSIGADRMSQLGPRWLPATTLLTIEIAGISATIYILFHPTLLARYHSASRQLRQQTQRTTGKIRATAHRHSQQLRSHPHNTDTPTTHTPQTPTNAETEDPARHTSADSLTPTPPDDLNNPEPPQGDTANN